MLTDDTKAMQRREEAHKRNEAREKGKYQNVSGAFLN